MAIRDHLIAHPRTLVANQGSRVRIPVVPQRCTCKIRRAMRGGSPYMHVDKGALSPALPHGQYPRPGYWPKRNTADKARTTHAGHRSQEWRAVKDTLKYKCINMQNGARPAPGCPRPGAREALPKDWDWGGTAATRSGTAATRELKGSATKSLNLML